MQGVGEEEVEGEEGEDAEVEEGQQSSGSLGCCFHACYCFCINNLAKQ